MVFGVGIVRGGSLHEVERWMIFIRLSPWSVTFLYTQMARIISLGPEVLMEN